MAANNAFQPIKLTKTERDRFGRIRSLDQLQALDPVAFERFCGYLYRKQGYKVSMTATTGDEGVDLFLEKGRRTAVVQCKRYSGTVGQPTVRDLYGTMLHNSANEAALVTTGRFSRAAETWAADKPLLLIDGPELISWARRERLAGRTVGRNWVTRVAVVVGVLILAVVGVAGAILGRDYFNVTLGGGARPTPIGLVVPTVADSPAGVTPTPQPTVAGIAPTATARPQPGLVTATRLRQPIEIDGDLTEWTRMSSVKSVFVVYTADGVTRPPSVSAEWRLAWDDDNLYLAVVVEDDRLVQLETGRLAYLGDSVELQIDTRQNPGTTLGTDDYQLLLSPGNFKNLQPSAFRFQGTTEGNLVDTPVPAVLLAAVQQGQGYILEAAVPWQALGMTPQADGTLGLALNVNDNDASGASAQEMMLSHVASRTLRDPTTWGTLRLDG